MAEETTDTLKAALKLRTKLSNLKAAQERAHLLVDGKHDAKREALLAGADRKVLEHLVTEGALPAGYLS